jgi:hypothetical protein
VLWFQPEENAMKRSSIVGQKVLVFVGALALAAVASEPSTAQVTISTFRPINDLSSGVLESYASWMSRVVPLAIPSNLNPIGPINPDFSSVTTFPITAPPYAVTAPPQYSPSNPAPTPTNAPALVFSRGSGVTELGVSNIGTNGQKVQFVSDLSVGNDTNWSDINIESSVQLYAFGFGIMSVHDGSVAAYGTSQFLITLIGADGQTIGRGVFAAPSVDFLTTIGAFEPDVMPGFVFVGVTSPIGFNRIELKEIAGGVQNSSHFGGVADREYFGAFYAAAVPEPSTIALYAVSLAGLVGLFAAKNGRRSS